MPREPRLLSARLWAAAAVSLLPSLLYGQRHEAPPPVPADPYTADPAVAARCGHATATPFPWAEGHTTDDIEKLLGSVPLRWIETAHFRLGSTLPAFVPPARDKRNRRRLAAELGRLRSKLPAVDPRTRKLDPWLRAHLFAQRIEEIYADFSRRIGVTDGDFEGEKGMGRGPFLGMPGKFTVLLLDKESSMSRYAQRYVGRDARVPIMHLFPRSGTLFFGAAAEFARGGLADDTFMHCTVVYGVVSNLVDGYRYYGHPTPVWIKAGLGQWYLRRLDPRYNNYALDDPDHKPDSRMTGWDWQPRVRGLVKNDRASPIAQMLGATGFRPWRFADYMFAWSRVDFLMRDGDAGLARFLRGMKAPFEGREGLPSQEDVFARQLDVLRSAFNLTPAQFDEEWRKWVLDHYRRRPLKRVSAAEIFPPR